MITRTLVAALLLAGLVPSQRTVVVDANNGPGTAHTDLPAALAALQDGDVIVVRAGTYTGASLSTGHSFAIVGEGSPTITPAGTGPTLYLTLNGLDNQRVTLTGLDVTSTAASQWALRCRAFGVWPAPTLHLEDCTVRSLATTSEQLALQVATAGLTAHRCTLGTTTVSDSAAVFVDSTIAGADASSNGPFTNFPMLGLSINESDVWLVNTTVRAGSSAGFRIVPTNAVFISDDYFATPTQLHLCGTSQLIGDPSPHANWTPPEVVRNYAPVNPQDPTITHEPSVTLVASPGGVVWGTRLTVVVADVPHLTLSTAPLGGTVTCDVHGAAGQLGAALLGLTTAPTALFSVPVFADLALAVTVGSVTIGASDTATFALAVPNDPLLQGLPLEYTGVVFDATTGALALTNPGTAVIR